MEKRTYSPPTIRPVSAEELRKKLDSMDMDELGNELPTRRSLQPPSVMSLLTPAERAQEPLWAKVYRGGPDAVLAARSLLAQAPRSVAPLPVVQPKGEHVEYVICTRDGVWWLTASGAAQYAADEAMRFKSELRAEEERSRYMRVAAEGGPKFVVRPLEVE